LPGEYTVKLTVDGRTYLQPLTVKMDPRVKIPAAGLARQFELAVKISELMEKDYQALSEVRLLRAHSTAEAADAVDQKAAALIGKLATLLEIVDGPDAAPTTQAVASVRELTKALESLRRDVASLK
jgi:hypothetical protein